MALFPIRRPTLGLHLRPGVVSLVDVGGDWRRAGRGRRLRRCCAREVPPDCVRLSSVEPNIVDMAQMADLLEPLAEPFKGRCVAVTVPDQAARLALFDFQSFPEKPADVDAVLRWRFQKELGVTVGQSRIQYRVFRAPGEGSEAGSRSMRVLVGVLREDIAAQYERLCQTVGLIPMHMGLSGPAMADALWDAMAGDSADTLFLHAIETGFTFMAFRRGVPAFLRVKTLHEGARPPGGPVMTTPREMQPDFRERMTEEILATLQYYTDQTAFGTGDRTPAAQSLYVVGEPQWQSPDAAGALLDLRVRRLGWESVPAAGGPAPDVPPGAGLPALAAVLAA